MRGRLRALIAIASTLISGVVWDPAESANLRVTPSLTLGERWDSNVFVESTNEVSDFVLRVSPALSFSLDIYRTTVNLTGGVDVDKYSNHKELDQAPTSKHIELTTAQPLALTPRFSALPTARVVETRDVSRRLELTQAILPGLPPSEQIAIGRTNTRETSAALRFVYVLTEKMDFGFGGGGVRRDFLDGAAGVVDSRALSGNVLFTYRITPRLTTGLYSDTTYNWFASGPDTRTYTVALSANHTFTENYSLAARAGATHLRSPTGNGDDRNGMWAPNGGFSVTFTSREFLANASFAYELSGGGSYGATTRRVTTSVAFSDRFAPRWSWVLSASYQMNRSVDSLVNVDVDTANGVGGLRYEAAEWVLFRIGGEIMRQWARDPQVGVDVNRYSVALGVTLGDTYSLF